MTNIKASDLPVGTRVSLDEAVYVRDRAGSDGWYRYPHGFYRDEEIDVVLGNGADVRRIEAR